MGVDLIEAKANTTDQGKATDLFPAGATKYMDIDGHVIEKITEVDGVIKFKYKGGVKEPEAAVEDAIVEERVIAIYNILGQKQMTTNIEELSRGTYVVETTVGNKKIVR